MHCVAACVNVYVIQKSQGVVYTDLTSCPSIQRVPQLQGLNRGLSGQLCFPPYILFFLPLTPPCDNLSTLHYYSREKLKNSMPHPRSIPSHYRHTKTRMGCSQNCIKYTSKGLHCTCSLVYGSEYKFYYNIMYRGVCITRRRN